MLSPRGTPVLPAAAKAPPAAPAPRAGRARAQTTPGMPAPGVARGHPLAQRRRGPCPHGSAPRRPMPLCHSGGTPCPGVLGMCPGKPRAGSRGSPPGAPTTAAPGVSRPRPGAGCEPRGRRRRCAGTWRKLSTTEGQGLGQGPEGLSRLWLSSAQPWHSQHCPSTAPAQPSPRTGLKSPFASALLGAKGLMEGKTMRVKESSSTWGQRGHH